MKRKHLRPRRELLVRAFGPCDESSTGWLNFACPYCEDEGHHFGIAPEGNGSCWRCSAKATRLQVLALIRQRTRLDRLVPDIPELAPPPEAIDAASDPGTGLREAPANRERLLRRSSPTMPSREEMLDSFVRLRHGMGTRSLITAKALRYCEKRRVDLDVHEIGLFTCRGLPDHYSRYVFWLWRWQGKPVYYQGRSIFKNEKRRQVNPAMKSDWSDKRDVLINADLIKAGYEVVITEGPFDAAAATDLGRERVGVPLLGKNMSERQLRLLVRKRPSRVIVMLDPPGKDPLIAQAVKNLTSDICRTGLQTFSVVYPQDERRDPSDLGPDLAARLIDQACRFSILGLRSAQPF